MFLKVDVICTVLFSDPVWQAGGSQITQSIRDALTGFDIRVQVGLSSLVELPVRLRTGPREGGGYRGTK